MFFQDEFSEILSKINTSYPTMTDFSTSAKLDRTYISKYINKKLNNPPTPKILEKLAKASNGLTTYENLMRICGYFGKIRGDRLKSCRLSKNLSIVEVADKVGISSKKLKYWEDGNDYNADMDVLNKLATLFNVDIQWLFGFNFSKSNNNDFRYATYNSVNLEGLTKEQIDKINEYVEFIKNQKK